MTRTCSECERTDIAGRGLCGRHYQLHKYRGDLDQVAPKYRDIDCGWCGRRFRATQRKTRFCSSKCWHKAKYEADAPDRRPVCGLCASPIIGKTRRAKYCSTKCEQDARNARSAAARREAKGACAYCGKKLPDHRRRFCSDACNYKARRNETYGLTPDELQALLAQHSVCAICHSDQWGKKGPVVDHDHETGRVRGILCGNCNMGLGRFKDDPLRLARAIAYLKT